MKRTYIKPQMCAFCVNAVTPLAASTFTIDDVNGVDAGSSFAGEDFGLDDEEDWGSWNTAW